MKEKEFERLTALKAIEKEIYNTGIEYICGIDEAGRGPLAGPLVVAGVVFPIGYDSGEINDSKQLTEKKREQLYDIIIRDALFYQIEIVEPEEIDRINILEADYGIMLQENLKQGKKRLYRYTDTAFPCPCSV